MVDLWNSTAVATPTPVPTLGDQFGLSASNAFEQTIAGTAAFEYSYRNTPGLNKVPQAYVRPSRGTQPEERFTLKPEYQSNPEAQPFSRNDWQNSEHYREGLEYRDDLSIARAKLLADDFDDRERRNYLLANADNGIVSTATQFAGALTGSAPTPESLIGLGAFGRVAVAAHTTRAARIGQAAKIGAIEGAIATAAAAPIIQPSLESRGIDYGIEEILTDIALGTVISGTLGGGGQGIADVLRARKTGRLEFHPEEKAALHDAVVERELQAQSYEGAAPNISLNPPVQRKAQAAFEKAAQRNNLTVDLGSPSAKDLNALPAVQPVTVASKRFTKDTPLKTARDTAFKQGLSDVRGRYTNAHTGIDIDVSRAGLQKATSAKSAEGKIRNLDNLELIPHIPELIERAVQAEYRSSAREGFDSVRRLYAPAIVQGKPYTVKLTVRKPVADSDKFYNLEAVELGNLTERVVRRDTSRLPSTLHASDRPSYISIQELLQNVKRDSDGRGVLETPQAPSKPTLTPQQKAVKQEITELNQEVEGGLYNANEIAVRDKAPAHGTSPSVTDADDILDDLLVDEIEALGDLTEAERLTLNNADSDIQAAEEQGRGFEAAINCQIGEGE